jgi:2-dehydropantoate 2-reductase
VFIVIVGIGALGSLMGAKLDPAADVTLFGHWSEQIRTVQTNGLWVEHPEGDRTRHEIKITSNPDIFDNAETVLVAVKSRQTGRTGELISTSPNKSSLVITLQNGLNNQAQFSSYLGANRIGLGITSEGATMLAPGLVRHAGHGVTYLGRMKAHNQELQTRLEDLGTLFNRVGLETHIVDNADGILWGKLAVNAAINPLTALLRVPNGFLLEYRDLKGLMALAAYEAASVAFALNIVLPYEDPAEQAYLVAQRTASNQSSMLQDILHGLPTEIDVICGAIVRIGRELSIPTPINERLFNFVTNLEMGKMSPLPPGDVGKLLELFEFLHEK